MHGISLIKHFCTTLPEKPGIYKMIGDDDELLYIGKAKNLKKRVTYYSKQALPTRLARMIFLTKKTEYLVTSSEAAAFLLEASQIKLHKPRFNILLKDDKSFPYIKITTDHDYPQILKYRGKTTQDTSLFGPFASISDLEKALNNLRKIFKLRSCTDSYFSSRKRPCLQYQIKRCSAPCVGKISKEEYSKTVDYTFKFLKGKTANLQIELSQHMQKFSEMMEYEKAAEVRDNIKALSYIQTTTDKSISNFSDIDVIGILTQNYIYSITVFFYRAGQNYGSRTYFPLHTEGIEIKEVLSNFIGQFYQIRISPSKILTNILLDEAQEIEEALYALHHVKTKFINPKASSNKNLMDHVMLNAAEALRIHMKDTAKAASCLKELQELLQLKEIPERIEIYDNSHIMGKFAVGAMVVAGADGFEKSEYRKFSIQTNINNFGGDDYQMLREVMTRRINKIKSEKSKIPSLMIIDGGKAHMNVVRKVMEERGIDIPYLCMSKGEKRDAGGETFHVIGMAPFTLSNDLPLMKYLQILRDEVHNFAIRSHRKKRSAAISISALDAIPSIGMTRKKMLLNHFGSVESIRSASEEELTTIESISKKIAQKIKEYLA